MNIKLMMKLSALWVLNEKSLEEAVSVFPEYEDYLKSVKGLDFHEARREILYEIRDSKQVQE